MEFDKAFFFLRESRLIKRVEIIKSSQSFAGARQWYKNTACTKSTHYLIGIDGRTIQMVQDEDIARQSDKEKDKVTIYIEVCIDPNGVTQKQYQEIASVVDTVINRWGIPLSSEFITSSGFEKSQFDVNMLLLLLKPVEIKTDNSPEQLNQSALSSKVVLDAIKNGLSFYRDDERAIGLFVAPEELRRKLGREHGFTRVDSVDLVGLNTEVKKYTNQISRIKELEADISLQEKIIADQAKRIKRLEVIGRIIRYFKGLFKPRVVK